MDVQMVSLTRWSPSEVILCFSTNLIGSAQNGWNNLDGLQNVVNQKVIIKKDQYKQYS